MNEDYLWNRTGPPDPEVLSLEDALAPLRWKGIRKKRHHVRWLAAAAAVLITAGGAILWHQHSLSTWRISIESSENRLRAGQWIETAREPALVRSDSVGRLDVEPNSRLRLLSDGDHGERFALERGTIHALIWAPPARFVVETAAARTVDLGCEYTLHVDRNGNGAVTVEMGWVAFAWHGLESFIPAGAACHTRSGHGPGIPYFLDAPAAFRSALARYDDGQASSDWLDTVLRGARPRDALSLWHLLHRTSGEERARVYDRLAQLVTLPPAASRSAILSGDPRAFDAAWNALDLGDTSWWREWKRDW